MSTVLDIANELTKVFIRAENKKYCVNHIIIEINSLYYADSKEPIEYELKTVIINVIESNLLTHAEDSIAFSALKADILSGLDIRKEKKKVSVNWIDNLDLLKQNLEKYFLR